MTMWKPYIWPKLRTSKNAPTPDELIASLPWTAIHWASKFCCDRYPVKAVRMETVNVITPDTQVRPRPSRQAPWKKAVQRCRTMKKKKAWTDQKWMLLKKWPMVDECHH